MVIDGEISAIDFYITLSHKILYKENEFQVIHREEDEGNIMLVKLF